MRRITLLGVMTLWLCGVASAQGFQLSPNQPVTVRFESVKLIEKGTPAANFPGVAAQGEFLLDATGTVLTVRLQNVSTATANATLYALDLGLPQRLVSRNKLEATFSEFPENANWLGPTDNPAPTGGLGFCVFAARAAALQRFEDFLVSSASLPPGFLMANQRGTVTLKLIYLTGGQEATLRVEPRLYFLAPDTKAPQTKRVQLVVSSAAR